MSEGYKIRDQTLPHFITATVVDWVDWRTDAPIRKYGYEYDNLNRLKNATYQKPLDAIPVSGAYNESLTYDKKWKYNVTKAFRK